MKRRSSLLTGSVASSVSCPISTKVRKVEIDHDSEPGDLPCDTEAGLLYLKALFPVEKFDRHFPAIVMKHQVYSIVHDKTTVDREMITLRDSRKVRFFKLGVATDEVGVVFTDDYVARVKHVMGDTPLCRKFVGTVLTDCTDVSISREHLISTLHLSQEEITAVVNHGVLVMRDVGSWWFAIPGISAFVKSFTKGRTLLLQAIKRSKFREVLQKNLMGRHWSGCRLGIEYHIHDIIGAEFVQCIETTSGPLLKLSEDARAS
ncbi:hypothetical protein EMCRGX_G028533 [Ephydatia muelleri]|eukprot:Em0020g121a